MKFFLALFLLAAAACAEEAKGDKEGATAFAEISKKLEEQSKKLAEQDRKFEEQNKELKEMKKSLAEQRVENEKLEKEVASQKLENLDARKTEAILREADAKLREADARILRTNEKQTAELRREAEKRQAAPKRQNDAEGMISETRGLILEEILKYHASHNDTTTRPSKIELKPLKAINGVTNENSESGSGYPTKDAFSTDKTYCIGWRPKKEWTNPFPHLLSYEFPTLHTPAKISFRRVKVSSDYGTPKKWQFVATADPNCDKNSNWTVLCGDIGGENIVSNQVVGCDVPKKARSDYKCLGLRIYSNHESRTDNSACFRELKFWEVVEVLK